MSLSLKKRVKIIFLWYWTSQISSCITDNSIISFSSIFSRIYFFLNPNVLMQHTLYKIEIFSIYLYLFTATSNDLKLILKNKCLYFMYINLYIYSGVSHKISAFVIF